MRLLRSEGTRFLVASPHAAELVERIKEDTAIAEEALEDGSKRQYSQDPFLLG